jgi:MoaA/NifB/PqqE/SkfB family radical SAM enzyme
MSALENSLHYAQRGLGLLTNLALDRYVHCNLQVTRRCNFRCQICDFWKVEHAKERELNLQEIETLTNKLAEYGTLAISLAGGEPMLREDLLDIIRIVSQKHFPIMITNGWCITKENAHALWEAGLQEISISIDYADSQMHDAMRGHPGAFERAVQSLKILHESRHSNRNRVHMISVLMNDNVEDVEKLIHLSRQLGVTYMVNLYSYQRGRKRERLPKQPVSKHLVQLKKKYPHFVSLTSYLERMDAAVQQGGVGNCQAGRYFMNIDNYGNIARCTETTDTPVGNLLKESPERIKQQLLHQQSNDRCSQCWTSCRGWAELMHGPRRLRSWKEFYITVQPVKN